MPLLGTSPTKRWSGSRPMGPDLVTPDPEGVRETREICADAELVREIRQALAELQLGDVLSTEAVLEGLVREGRRP